VIGSEKDSRPGGNAPEWSVRMADSVMQRPLWRAEKWAYEWGLAFKSIEQVWRKTHDDRYWDYIQRNVTRFVGPDGDIRTYRLEEYNLDRINPGKLLFPLYSETGDERYKRAASLLRQQLRTHPRTREGGFWHKQAYPHQMWLDGIYMAAPFCAEFARTFDEPEGFDDVAHQVVLIAEHTRDPVSGLLYHGWDESRSQRWADPETGCSPNFWGRAMGWYAMGIVDVLDHLPANHPRRAQIIRILQDVIAAVAAVQDPPTGLWYQVLDQGDREGNYLEASASCMFVYALAKGARKGYIDTEYLDVARRGYAGIVKHFVQVDDQGVVNLHRICSVAGLGRQAGELEKPYRDGSFEYYIGEEIVANDHKGVGPFILASVQVERWE
jgi:unsaturated rhamnogalacturonyl hydrolase